MTDSEREEAMNSLYEEYARVNVLAELAAGRPPVRGSGRLDSPVLVIGEAPGEEEDRLGRPFVGKSGRLLQELLAGAGIPWGMCYVTNAVCWRPPANRTPYPFQLQASEDRAETEIALVDPVIVVAAGASAWRTVTRGKLGRFDAARFEWHELNGRRLLCIPHPAALLRLKGAERESWEQATRAALREALPQKATA